MSGMPILVISAVLVLSSIVGFALWAKVRDEPSSDRLELMELAVFLALELSRSDMHLQSEEVRIIERFLAERLPDLDVTPEHLVSKALIRPTGPRAARDAVRVFESLGPSDEDRQLVLSLLAQVIRVDGAVAPEEAIFFHRVAKALGYDKQLAARTFGIEPHVPAEG